MDKSRYRKKNVGQVAKDLVNKYLQYRYFRSLFYGDDIQNNMVIVIPYIRWIDVIRTKDINAHDSDGKIYYFNVGFSGMANPERYQFETHEQAVSLRNEVLIQIENYHSKGQ